MRVVVEAGELLEVKKEEREKKTEEGEGGETGPTGVEERTIIDDLAEFLSQRLGKEVMISGDEVHLEVEGSAMRKRVKQLLKKFLHKQGLKEDLRVISVGEGVFRIKKRRFPRLKAPALTWA